MKYELEEAMKKKRQRQSSKYGTQLDHNDDGNLKRESKRSRAENTFRSNETKQSTTSSQLKRMQVKKNKMLSLIL